MKRRGRRPVSRVAFLDRDGTLIDEGDYPRDPDRVRLIPGAVAALKALKRAHFKIVVVSNQSGVGRGIVTPAEMRGVDARFRSILRKKGIRLDGAFYCPHAPSKRCACRKPKPGLLKRAARELGIPWRGGFSVGDRPSDVQLGQRSGGVGILVRTGYGGRWANRPEAVRPDANVADVGAAVKWILKFVERNASR